ncbi:Protein CHROMATIN REMODELING 24 [Diplonema papillatum]|nr:Protein CHROMATIN REMODELING 24 [Diplonema papillatum]
MSRRFRLFDVVPDAVGRSTSPHLPADVALALNATEEAERLGVIKVEAKYRSIILRILGEKLQEQELAEATPSPLSSCLSDDPAAPAGFAARLKAPARGFPSAGHPRQDMQHATTRRAHPRSSDASFCCEDDPADSPMTEPQQLPPQQARPAAGRFSAFVEGTEDDEEEEEEYERFDGDVEDWVDGDADGRDGGCSADGASSGEEDADADLFRSEQNNDDDDECDDSENSATESSSPRGRPRCTAASRPSRMTIPPVPIEQDHVDRDSTEFYPNLGISVTLCEQSQMAVIPVVPGAGTAEDGGAGLEVPTATWLRLYPHQKEGVCWLWRQTCRSRGGEPGGGILGDEMGLGKTIQLLVFLDAALRGGRGKTALIAVPPTVLRSWQAHQETWCPKMRLATLTSETPLVLRSKIIDAFITTTTPAVLLTTYGMLQSLNKRHQLLNKLTWDYIVLDEGHLIKNPSSQTAKAARSLHSNTRFILTGTPVQNSLDELWALYHFVEPRLFGMNNAAFRKKYTDPIRKGTHRNATALAVKASNEMSDELRSVYAPYILQRKQDIVQHLLGLHSKIDVVIWCGMTELQQKVYAAFLEGSDVKECVMKREMSGAICMLTSLRKLCNHLWLQQGQDRLQSKLASAAAQQGVDVDEGSQGSFGSVFDPAGHFIDDCSKMEVLLKIFQRAREGGDRLLIFSQSVKMLNIIATVLHCAFPASRLLRLDGSTKIRDRQGLVDRFNNDTTIDAMLLTTGVGGVGLTLTGASKVVIFDPDWNPAKDSQAIGRAHRIGQTRQVVVYRLMTCGSVEEFTYRQEVFKECIERKTTQNASILRYFTPVELHAMFRFTPRAARTLEQLTQLQGDVQYPPEVEDLFAELADLPHVKGITDHDAVFQATEPDDDLDESLNTKFHNLSLTGSHSGHGGASASSASFHAQRAPSVPMQQCSSPASTRATFADLAVNTVSTPQVVLKARDMDEAAFDYTVPQAYNNLSPDLLPAASCADLPRDMDDCDMLKAAEEAFVRHSSISPAKAPLGLPPRHSASKSPAIRIMEKCPNCDFVQFPFCPITGRPHTAGAKHHRVGSDDAGSGSDRDQAATVSPPVYPPQPMEAKLAMHVDEEYAVSFSSARDASGSHPAGHVAMPFLCPHAPYKTRELCSVLSVGSAQRELSFGASTVRLSEENGNALSPAAFSFGCPPGSCHSAGHESAPGAPMKCQGRRDTVESFWSVGPAQRELSFGTASCATQIVVQQSLVVPDAPNRANQAGGPRFSTGSAQRELSFGGTASNPFESASRETVTSIFSANVGNAVRGLSFGGHSDSSRVTSSSPQPAVHFCPPAPNRMFCNPMVRSGSGAESCGGLEMTHAQRELSFGGSSVNRSGSGAGTEAHFSFASCCSASTAGVAQQATRQAAVLYRHETPQGTAPLQCAPGAPLRGGGLPQRSGSGSSSHTATSSEVSVGPPFASSSVAPFLSPFNYVHDAARGYRHRSHCSDSVASGDGNLHFDDDSDAATLRSASRSTDDSLQIRHSIMMHTPPPL